MKNQIIHLFLFAISVLFVFSCKKESINTTKTIPVLVNPSSSDIGNITDSTATINASVSSEGGAPITAKGVCWSTNHNPTIADNKTINRQGTGNSVPNKTNNGTGVDDFTATLTGLSPQTTYYVRVYGTNSFGTGYSNEIEFTTTGNILDSTVTDIDGNVYQTVRIGTQVWMAENLKTTRYNDGSAIITGLSRNDWQNNISGAYVIYANIASNNATYGKLYNWYAVNTGKLAPIGWHVPTDSEWLILVDFLGGDSVAGGKMKSTSILWTQPNISADNSSGFSGLPGGYLESYDNYTGIGIVGYWWSSVENFSTSAFSRYLYYNSDNALDRNREKYSGLSVRCIRD